MLESTYENIIKAQQGNAEVLESLVKNNMGLVYNIAKRFVGRGYEIEDLNQIGAMGLVKSIKKFDTNYNVQLSTYAVPFIIGEIKRYIPGAHARIGFYGHYRFTRLTRFTERWNDWN